MASPPGIGWKAGRRGLSGPSGRPAPRALRTGGDPQDSPPNNKKRPAIPDAGRSIATLVIALHRGRGVHRMSETTMMQTINEHNLHVTEALETLRAAI